MGAFSDGWVESATGGNFLMSLKGLYKKPTKFRGYSLLRPDLNCKTPSPLNAGQMAILSPKPFIMCYVTFFS